MHVDLVGPEIVFTHPQHDGARGVVSAEVDVLLGDPSDRTNDRQVPADIDGLGSPRSEELRIP